MSPRDYARGTRRPHARRPKGHQRPRRGAPGKGDLGRGGGCAILAALPIASIVVAVWR